MPLSRESNTIQLTQTLAEPQRWGGSHNPNSLVSAYTWVPPSCFLPWKQRPALRACVYFASKCIMNQKITWGWSVNSARRSWWWQLVSLSLIELLKGALGLFPPQRRKPRSWQPCFWRTLAESGRKMSSSRRSTTANMCGARDRANCFPGAGLTRSGQTRHPQVPPLWARGAGEGGRGCWSPCWPGRQPRDCQPCRGRTTEPTGNGLYIWWL